MVIDSDYRGIDGNHQPYNQRDYRCARCRHEGQGWKLLRQSPSEFLLQPHRLYPMTQAAFDDWVEILREHFPEHPMIKLLGTSFRLCLPEEADAPRAALPANTPLAACAEPEAAISKPRQLSFLTII